MEMTGVMDVDVILRIVQKGIDNIGEGVEYLMKGMGLISKCQVG
jgi:hypothetical protein